VRVASDEALRESLALEASKAAADYDWHVVAGKYESALQEAIMSYGERQD
jgi:hypothetical protein